MNATNATPFVPLIAKPRSCAFQALGAQPPAEPPPVEAPPATEPPPVAAKEPEPACTVPVITLTREGEQVTHITIRCTCGEVIELACVY
jgi:hypothetical protein